MAKRKQSAQKRWPGRFAIDATIYTPAGNRLDISTDMDDETGQTVLDALVAAVTAEEVEEEEPDDDEHSG